MGQGLQCAATNYFGARYYDSSLGRFLTPDWSLTPEAVPYANLAQPQSLDLYAYEGDNPTSRVDKDGHCWPWCTVLAGAAIGAATGAVIEVGSEWLQGQPLNAGRIEHAAFGGAITGGILGAGGPEAAAAVGLSEDAVAAALGMAGSVAGGAADRGLNGEPALKPSSVAADAITGGGSAIVGGLLAREVTTTAVREAAARAADAGVTISISVPGPDKPNPTPICKGHTPCDLRPASTRSPAPAGPGGGR